MKDIEPQDGEVRDHTFYAWWPVTIDRETRWLEYVTTRQIYGRDTGALSFPRRWLNAAFVDDQDEKS